MMLHLHCFCGDGIHPQSLGSCANPRSNADEKAEIVKKLIAPAVETCFNDRNCLNNVETIIPFESG